MQLILKSILVISVLGLFVFASSPNFNENSNIQSKDFNTYVLDTAKSKIHWNCTHFGKMKFNEGYIIIKDNEPDKVNLSIDMTSITNTDIDNKLLQGTLENVLKSIEFFNTEKYPEAHFESHSVTKTGNNNYNFEGDFIIFENGICSKFKGTLEIDQDTLHLNTKTIIIDRTDWGIYYLSANNLYPKEEEAGFIVSDSILFDAHITAYKK